MTYRVRLPGTSGELTFESRDEAREVLGTDRMRLPFDRPGPPMVMGRRRRRQQRAAAEASAGRRLARGPEPAPAPAPGRRTGPSHGVVDDEGV